jgi:hypothetical protein
MTDRTTLKQFVQVISKDSNRQTRAQKGTLPPPDENLVTRGLVFAKTVFQGVVKARYIELMIVDQMDLGKEYQLIIGEKERSNLFFGGIQTVKPGYLFIDLPEGQYRIMSISIPVGTTKAQETMDVEFVVKGHQAIYLGTLKVSGTKEKIRLGRVPVIQPGFEYTVSIVNEEEEAYKSFYSQYPDFKEPIKTQLMRVNQATNVASGSG